MNPKRALLAAGIPVAGILFFAAVLAFRGRPEIPERKRGTRAPEVEPAPRTAQIQTTAQPVRYTPPPRPTAAPSAPRAAEEARIRALYQDYRTAVATGNEPLQEALRPVLVGVREIALRFAEDSLARAQSERDREIALQTLDALRR